MQQELSYAVVTGIKALDLLVPLPQGGKTACWRRVGMTVLVIELMQRTVREHHGVAIFAGIGERTREANELYLQMRDAGVLANSTLVFGQMNETPAPAFAWASRRCRSPNSFVTRSARTCCCSSTTSIALPRRAWRSARYLVASRPCSATSRRLKRRWAYSRSESPTQARAR